MNIPLVSMFYLFQESLLENHEISKIRNVKMEFVLTLLKDCPAYDHSISTNIDFNREMWRLKNEKKSKKGLI